MTDSFLFVARGREELGLNHAIEPARMSPGLSVLKLELALRQ